MSQSVEIVNSDTIQTIPILPLRDIVVYPHTMTPLVIGRSSSIKALEMSTSETTEAKQILLVTQKEASDENPSPEGLYRVGTLATVIPLANALQLLRLSDGTARVLVEGTQRCIIEEIIEESGYFSAKVIPIKNIPSSKDSIELQALVSTTLAQFEEYLTLSLSEGSNNSRPSKKVSEILTLLFELEDPDRIADTIATHVMTLRVREKQELLETLPVESRLKKLGSFLERELQILKAKKQLKNTLEKQGLQDYKTHYLNEQLKAIQKELNASQGITNEYEKLEERIQKARMPKVVNEKAINELNKLKTMSPMTAEATVSRNYLDALINVPWHKKTKVSFNIEKAEKTLDEAHYGLEKIKERIVEFLAVQKRVGKIKGNILCLVGPPGVGKTSLGASIAQSTGRAFVRMSLGGVRDEAEIRGHRRTYIGSMPGQIMQKMSKGGVKNPVFMLDEVDKMAMDFRGDPASALLEVLDPEQNHSFNDHYLEVDYDLSEVLFIATANTLNIPEPLLDRMEIIHISSYTENEKLNIAQRYLVSKQKKQHGLKSGELVLDESVALDIIRYYTREAGVRGLEREIAKLCRKIIMNHSKEPEPKTTQVTSNTLERYLGVRRFRHGLADEEDQIGQVTGLAWTEVGGALLTIEAAVTPGKEKMIYTGHLGKVMQESIQTAFTVVRSRSKDFGITSNFYETVDLHVHVPEGATPKDGPSAGIGICTALISSLTGNPVRFDVAMTGEITLLGKVLPIGGLKEKLLAAHRGGIRIVIIPADNERDLKDIPQTILKDLTIHPVRCIDQVIKIAFRIPLKELVSEKDDQPSEDMNVFSDRTQPSYREKSITH